MKYWNMANGYMLSVVDDGTLDLLVSVALLRDSEIGEQGEIHIVRLHSESFYMWRNADGSVDMDAINSEIDLWADHMAESRS
jgi:hypothetical protein